MSFVLWGLYWPMLKLVSFFVFWLPEFQERKKFEKKNALEPLAHSFAYQNIAADLCFEFSSEGEYQQVASLIDDCLKMGKKIELIFFSPSVEKTIVELAAKYPSQVRYLRYPIANFSPFGKGSSFTKWVTAKKLVLVRYDLFPEFLMWSRGAGHELSIVWVSFKKERINGKAISFLKRLFLNNSRKLVFASEKDKEMGQMLGHEGPVYDFRMEQIRRRVALRETKFLTHFPAYQELKKNLEKFPREKRLIIGNAWPSDLFLFHDLPEDYFVMIVPHQLTPEILNAFRKGMEELGRDVVMVADELSPAEGDTYVLNKKGVLCELYADFGRAYVGGGFEASVHSVLEPLVAGADMIAVGPKHQRSTEFDVAMDFRRATEVKTAQDLAHWLEKNPATTSANELNKVFEDYQDFRKEVISC